MKSKTIPRKLKKGDAKMIEHPKKKRKRLSMKSKTGGVCKAKHERRAVGAYREHDKVAANTHPPHPDMTATLLAMKDPVRHNLQSRGAIPARVADADVEFTNHVREDANCARETRLFKEAETEAKAKQAAASGKKDESSSPIADAETTERPMDKEGKATGTVFPGRGGKTVPGRVAEKLTRTQVDIDCFVDAFQAVRPDVTVNETIACLESHDKDGRSKGARRRCRGRDEDGRGEGARR